MVPVVTGRAREYSGQAGAARERRASRNLRRTGRKQQEGAGGQRQQRAPSWRRDEGDDDLATEEAHHL
jgi:hypothetical protein